jgi:putative transposase
VLKNLDCRPVIVNGVEDHLHLLFLLPRELSAGTAAEKIKANSSRWLKTKCADFQWQRGYSAFSVSKSNLTAVKHYILGQEEHHRKVSFQEELKKFLDKHEIEYDEHYLGD